MIAIDVELDEGEQIAKVEGYKHYYVTTRGRVYSSCGKGRWLKPVLYKKTGYYEVCLSNKGRVKKLRVHRLVAIAFIENPDNLPEVDHINRNRTDNRVENFRWSTHKDNSNNRNPWIRKGSVYYNKRDGKWIARWYIDPNSSKRKSKLFVTREEAQEYIDKHNIQKLGVIVQE